MDERTIEHIRKALIERCQRIEAHHGEVIEKSASDDAAPLAEIIDIAQSLEQLGRDISLEEQERRELNSIQRALAKMQSGSFGVCEDCSEEIPVKRLMIVPAARLCAHCQSLEERTQYRGRVAMGR